MTAPNHLHDRAHDGHNPAADGCTGCGSQDTVTLDGRFGRRCANCPPWRAHAAAGDAMAAFTSLRAWLLGRGWGT